MTDTKMTNDTMMNDTTNVSPENMKLDDKVVKKIVASALLNVDGFLGTSGGGIVGSLTGMLQKNASAEDEILSGISADTKDGLVTVSMKAITEAGKNIPTIVDQMTANVVKALREVGGLQTKAVNVEIVDTMTKAEYEKKHTKAEEKVEETK